MNSSALKGRSVLVSESRLGESDRLAECNRRGRRFLCGRGRSRVGVLARLAVVALAILVLGSAASRSALAFNYEDDAYVRTADDNSYRIFFNVPGKDTNYVVGGGYGGWNARLTTHLRAETGHAIKFEDCYLGMGLGTNNTPFNNGFTYINRNDDNPSAYTGTVRFAFNGNNSGGEYRGADMNAHLFWICQGTFEWACTGGTSFAGGNVKDGIRVGTIGASTDTVSTYDLPATNLTATFNQETPLNNQNTIDIYVYEGSTWNIKFGATSETHPASNSLGSSKGGGLYIYGAGNVNIVQNLCCLASGDGQTVHVNMSSGACIDIYGGATLRNGGWAGQNWSNNKADMVVNGTLDIWDGNEVTIDGLSGSGTVTMGNGSNRTLHMGSDGSSGSGRNVFNGTIQSGSGTVNIEKIGSGTQILAGANTYTGTTTVSGGTLQIGNNGTTGTLGTGSVSIASGAKLKFNRTNSYTVANTISGNGGVEVAAGTVILTANNSYGTTTINSGTTLQVGNGGSTGTLGKGNVTNNSTVNINRTGTTTFSQLMGGSSSSTFSGGLFQLTDTGTVDVDRTGLGPSTLAVYNDAAVLNLNATTAVTSVSNKRGTLNSNATLTATSLKTGDYSGYTTAVTNINSGANVTLASTTNSVSNGAGMVIGHWHAVDYDHYAEMNVNGGTLSMTGSNLEVSWDGGGILNVNGGTVNVKGLLLVDHNASVTYRQFNLNGGTVNLGANGLRYVDSPQNADSSYPAYDTSNDKAASSSTAELSWIKLGAGTLGTLAAWSSNANMELTDASTGTTFNTNGYDITLNGAMSGSGKLVKIGGNQLTLNGANVFAGGLDAQDGTVRFKCLDETSESVGTLSTGAIALSNNAMLHAYGTTDDTSLAYVHTLANDISVSGSGSLRSGHGKYLKLAGAITGDTLNIGSDSGYVALGNSSNAISNLSIGTARTNWTTGETKSAARVILEAINALGNAIVQFNMATGATGGNYVAMNGYSASIRGLIADSANADYATVQNLSEDAASTLTINTADDTSYGYYGKLTDGGSAALNLAKAGAGTQVLLGTNDYTGTTSIQAGVLRLDESGKITESAYSIAEGAQLVYNNTVDVTAGNFFAGSGTIRKQNEKTLLLNGSDANTFDGEIWVNGGTLQVASSFAQANGFVEGCTLELLENGELKNLTLTKGNVVVDGGAITDTLTINDDSSDDDPNEILSGTVNAVDLQQGDLAVEGGEITTLTQTSGKVTASAGSNVAIANYDLNDGELEMQNGSIETLTQADGTATIAGGTVENASLSDGDLTVSGGQITDTLTQTGGTATVSDGSVNQLEQSAGTSEISGGSVANASLSDGELTVSGGQITDTLEQSAGTVAISDGSVATLAQSGGTATVDGGTVTTLETAGELTISGEATVGELTISENGLVKIVNDENAVAVGDITMEGGNLSIQGLDEATSLTLNRGATLAMLLKDDMDVASLTLDAMTLNGGALVLTLPENQPTMNDDDYYTLFRSANAISGSAVQNLSRLDSVVVQTKDGEIVLDLRGADISQRLAVEENQHVIRFAMPPYPTAVPEPGTWVLLVLGLVGLGVVSRRRRLAA